MIGKVLVNELNNSSQNQLFNLEYIHQSNNIYVEELNIDSLCTQLQYESDLIDSYMSLLLTALAQSFDTADETINKMLSYIGVINQSNPNYHEPELDTNISKSVDVNIRGFERSLEICNKYKDLSIKEKELIQDETRLTTSLLNQAAKKHNSFILQYEGLSLDQLSTLFKGITKANDKLMQIKKITNFKKALQICSPTGIKKLPIANKPSYDDVKNAILAVHKDIPKFIIENKELFPYMGIGKIVYNDKTGLIHYTGVHPKYKIGLTDKNQQLDIIKNKSLLLNLFQSKLKLIPYLDYVINSIPPIEQALGYLKSIRDQLLKLKEENKDLYKLAMIGISIVRNHSRLYAVIDYKITKACKYVSRKIRLIQTQLKRQESKLT